MSSRTKKIIIAIVVIIIVFFLYSYLTHNSDSTDTLLTETAGVDANIGHDFISLLGKIQAIKLDEKFFTSAVFNSLKDSRVNIAPQPVGRNNPFAPLGAPESF